MPRSRSSSATSAAGRFATVAIRSTDSTCGARRPASSVALALLEGDVVEFLDGSLGAADRQLECLVARLAGWADVDADLGAGVERLRSEALDARIAPGGKQGDRGRRARVRVDANDVCGTTAVVEVAVDRERGGISAHEAAERAGVVAPVRDAGRDT